MPLQQIYCYHDQPYAMAEISCGKRYSYQNIYRDMDTSFIDALAKS